MAILTPEQLRTALDEATTKGFPHFNKLDWLPEWTTDKPKLEPNIKDEPKIEPKPLNCSKDFLKSRIEKLKVKYPDDLKHVSADREVEDPTQPETGPKLTKLPHAGAAFNHVDAGVLTNDEKAKFRGAIKALRDLEHLAKKDGELNRTIQQGLQPLNQADGLLDIDPKGMQRLKLIFEWTLCHVTTLYGEINAALAMSTAQNPQAGKSEYNAARDRYIALLQDLDDHEPETKGEPRSGERGYGRAIKWAYILPLIHDGKIKGAKIIAKWNPHISSSGIPIPHS